MPISGEESGATLTRSLQTKVAHESSFLRMAWEAACQTGATIDAFLQNRICAPPRAEPCTPVDFRAAQV